MKVWRLESADGEVIAEIPMNQVLDPRKAAAGREGYGVYEALGGDGVLLYTGRTKNLDSRLRYHSTQSPWWGFAAEIRWAPCSDYAEAVALERVGISQDRGAWNLVAVRDISGYDRQRLPQAVAHRLVAQYAETDSDRWAQVDFDNLVATLRFAGWTLEAIAEPLMITREAVRLRSTRGSVDFDLALPSPERRQKPSRKIWPTISEATKAQMRELQELANLCRGRMRADHPSRIASERLTELIVEAKIRGVREREIAEACGVAPVTIRQRIKRHGYMKQSPSQKSYLGAGGWIGGPKDSCNRGHRLEGDNLRLINGDRSRRVCRACERIRVERYRAKLKAA